MMRWSWALAIMAAACGGNVREADMTPADEAVMDTVAGQVEMFGTEAMAYPLVRTEQGAVRLSGPMASEVGRATGAVVRAWGMRHAARPQDRMEVSGYSVVSVNGRPVHMGVLEATAAGLQLRGTGTVWRLTNVPERLAALTGATVYVAGNLADGVLSVENWGVLRNP